MTTVNGASRTQPARQPSAPASPNNRTQPEPADVRAMSDAFAAARGKMPGGEQRMPLTRDGGKPIVGGDAKKPAAAKAQTGDGKAPERSAVGQQSDHAPIRQQAREEGQDALAGFAGTPAAPPPHVVTADIAAAHVDAGAFAQMLADLWTRENGKGAREVHVRFGNRSWPATGARLVRNAAGTLDVALLVGDGGRAYGDKMPDLEAALSDAGIELGSLELSTDA